MPRSLARRLPRTLALAAALGLTLTVLAGLASLPVVPAAKAAGTVSSAATITTRENYMTPIPDDLSDLSWVRAFDTLHAKISREYAFTSWKGIDWAALRTEYRPAIVKAQKAGDEHLYYLTLCRYIHELRDGHASTAAFDEQALALQQAVLQERAAGGFGLVLTRLANGNVVASWIQPNGPAARAGIKPGARILAWGGRPIDAAIARASTALSPNMPTDGRLDRERLRFLARAPIGAAKQIVFRNRGGQVVRSVRLRAAADDFVTLNMTDERSVLNRGWPQKVVEHQILPGSIGYVRVYLELDLPAEQPGDHTPTLQLFRQAIDQFIAADVRGVILDIRGNSGGEDEMAAAMLGSFYTKRTFYEYGDFFNILTGRFEIWTLDPDGQPVARGAAVCIDPAPRQYTGPVVALVNNGCISSGEGLAMGIKRLPNGRICGFSGTNGSFGMAGDLVLMPLNIEVKWPYGRSLGARKVVQIDARYGNGGVTPNTLVPMTWKNVRRQGQGHDVVLEYGLKALDGMAKR